MFDVFALYIMDEQFNPVSVDDFTFWCKWHHDHDIRVALDKIGETVISTVFIGCNFPYFFETMIFGGEYDCYQERYTSHTYAIEGHAKALALVKELGLPE